MNYHENNHLPLLIVCGAAGTGKSTVLQHLRGRLNELVVPLEGDILWRPEFDQPATKYRDFFETWLWLCENISQAGRPVVLFCSGAIPENIETCDGRRFFSAVHYLAQTCEDEELEKRLRARPGSQAGNSAFIEDQIKFNQWFKNHAGEVEPAIDLIDTTNGETSETALRVIAWVQTQLEKLEP